jgi:hypothetical protein
MAFKNVLPKQQFLSQQPHVYGLHGGKPVFGTRQLLHLKNQEMP